MENESEYVKRNHEIRLNSPGYSRIGAKSVCIPRKLIICNWPTYQVLTMQTYVERFIVRSAKLLQSVVAPLNTRRSSNAESTGHVEEFD